MEVEVVEVAVEVEVAALHPVRLAQAVVVHRVRLDRLPAPDAVAHLVHLAHQVHQVHPAPPAPLAPHHPAQAVVVHRAHRAHRAPRAPLQTSHHRKCIS